MTMADADKMLEMKNYPETRAYAILTTDVIERKAHYEWLEKNLHYFQVIESVSGMIGAIRIFGGEISIWIDRNFWGLGVATSIIRQVREPGMVARIVIGNIPSMRAFIKAGFRPVACVENKYLMFKCEL